MKKEINRSTLAIVRRNAKTIASFMKQVQVKGKELQALQEKLKRAEEYAAKIEGLKQQIQSVSSSIDDVATSIDNIKNLTLTTCGCSIEDYFTFDDKCNPIELKDEPVSDITQSDIEGSDTMGSVSSFIDPREEAFEQSTFNPKDEFKEEDIVDNETLSQMAMDGELDDDVDPEVETREQSRKDLDELYGL